MTETTETPTGAPAAKVRGALLRYRILAWFTGLWLLLLVAEVTLKVLAGGWDSMGTGLAVISPDNAVLKALDIVPIVHGWVYFVYLIFTVDLAIKVRWSASKIILTCIAGTIPFLSFWFEHIRTKEVKEQYGL